MQLLIDFVFQANVTCYIRKCLWKPMCEIYAHFLFSKLKTKNRFFLEKQMERKYYQIINNNTKKNRNESEQKQSMG